MFQDLPWSESYSPPRLPRSDPRAQSVPVNVPVFEEPMHYMVSVQSFSAGGFEAVVRLVDAQKMAERSGLARHTGKRLQSDERNESNIFRSQMRAKKQVRYRVKEICADRLLTLTTRQQENTVDELCERWQRFLKLVSRAAGGRFNYVAVPEAHPTNPNHFHLHVAIAVYLNVNTIRRIWWNVCGGRGMGNVDIHWFKYGGALQRVAKVASYISKYIVKQPVERFNKKRYWSSRITLPKPKRYWLKARTLGDAFHEAAAKLGFMITLESLKKIYARDDLNLVWFEVQPGHCADPPF